MKQVVLAAFQKSGGCVDCGTTDVRVLEFDHVRGTKLFSIGTAIGKGCNESLLQAEIDKCDVVCANCHRIRTYERQGNNYRIDAF